MPVLWCQERGQTGYVSPLTDRVCLFLSQAEEVADYVDVDFLLRDLVPKTRWKVTTAICDFVDGRTGFCLTLEARLRGAIVQGSDGFLVELSKTVMEEFPVRKEARAQFSLHHLMEGGGPYCEVV